MMPGRTRIIGRMCLARAGSLGCRILAHRPVHRGPALPRQRCAVWGSRPARLPPLWRGKARYPHCQRPLSEELRSEVLASTALGELLNRKSHWLTVWTTSTLETSGIPRSQVRWSLSESGEEVDIVAAVLDEAWIFELKDREFGGGDAHPFSYRCSRYSPDKSWVLTPTIVSEEAKRIFREIASDREGGRFPGAPHREEPYVPVYVEGLSTFGPRLEVHIRETARRYARDQLKAVAVAAHIPVERILDSKFAEPAGSS